MPKDSYEIVAVLLMPSAKTSAMSLLSDGIMTQTVSSLTEMSYIKFLAPKAAYWLG